MWYRSLHKEMKGRRNPAPSWIFSVFRWRSSRQWQKQEGLLDLPPAPFPWDRTWKPPVRGFLPRSREKKHPYLQRDKGYQEESWQTGLAEFPPFYGIYLTILKLAYSSMTAHSSSDTVSESSGLLFLPYISLWRLPCHIKLILDKHICFFPVWFPCQSVWTHSFQSSISQFERNCW